MPIGILAVTRLGIVTHAPAAQQPPLRDPRHRRPRDAAAGHRPGHDADHDGPAARALRGLYPVRLVLDRRAERARAREEAELADATTTTSPRLPTRLMLFDLRGAGRRRVVKVVYVTLAFLMGGGLVLFGIGGDVSGGLVDAITERSGSGDDGDEALRGARARRAAAPRSRTRATPRCGPRSPARASSSRAPATTTTRTRAPTPTAGAECCCRPARVGARTSQLADTARRPRRQPDGPGLRRARRARQGGARAGGHRRGAHSAGTYASSAHLAYQAGPDPHGRPRARQGARADRAGHARGAQGPARPAPSRRPRRRRRPAPGARDAQPARAAGG